MKNTLLPLIFFLVPFFFPHSAFTQVLQPGFDKEEYKELMLLSVRTAASPDYATQYPSPAHFKMAYQCAVMGLDNLWDLWVSDKAIAVISIRGTTTKQESWLANLYAAMVPAKGSLNLGDDGLFTYELADHPKAAVHIGWLLSLAYLSRDILPKIDSCYKAGIKDYLLMGHSQGGAINFLLTAHLYHLQKQGRLPADIRFKTYCSAGPKPGNLYFAYDYEALTQGSWAYNVVNSADWVPETPMSIQTVDDFNTTNPFSGAKSKIRQLKFPTNLVLTRFYNKLDRPTRKARKRYEHYLGKQVSKMVKANLKTFQSPVYYKSNHYVRTGTTIVLQADAGYYQLFPDSKTNIFAHHFHKPYLYLLDKLDWKGNTP